MARLCVMVTNARRRKAVPIVRALGRAGMEVICADSIHHAAAFYSRYCRRRFVHPELESNDFVEALISELSRNPCDVIFPLDDDMLAVLSKYRQLLPNPNALLLPGHETLTFANDKSLLVPYASSLGIAVPHTIVIKGEEDLEGLANLQLPVVIKPSHGSGSRGLVYVEDRQEIERLCQAALAEGRRVLVQERLPSEGEALGYFALYDRNRRLVAQFMHRRLREYPLSGGPSTLREGIWDEDIACQSRRLLESLNWVGLAMVEFKRDPRDGRGKLMEINPRFWGSVALPIFSGVNFPVLAAKVTVGHAVKTVPRPVIGKKARWLWPGDLLHLAASLRRGRWPRGFLSLFDRHTCYDLLSLRDPLPAPMLIFSTLLSMRSPDGRRRLLPRNGGGPGSAQPNLVLPKRQTASLPQKAESAQPIAAVTVDVEDWFHILDGSAAPAIREWANLESRVERNTERMLEMFEQSNTRATFFWLGWVAERHKNLIRRCQQAGHEIASHGYGHVLAYQVGRDGFRKDVVRAKDILEDITGQPVAGFRAAGFGITGETKWAFDVIRQAGHQYDSSIFPAARGHGGIRGACLGPHVIKTCAGRLVEFPMSVVQLLGRRLSLFGGGYLRLAPKWLIRWGITRLHASGQSMIVYVHPREIDPGHPRLPLSLMRRFKCYINLRTTMPKLEWLCREYDFRLMRELADCTLTSQQPVGGTYSAAA